ncbi:glycosyltransferase family 4 protein [Desulfobacterota bacterium M19]
MLSVRRAAARRIDKRLAPLQAQQVSLFNRLSADLNKFHNQLDERIVRAIEIGQLSDWRLKIIGERQEFSAHINCLNSLLPDFERVMDLLFAGEENYQPANNSLILLDLIRGYMYEGGIWQLRQEINDFLTNRTYTPAPAQPLPPETDNPLKILVISGLFPSIEHGGGLRLFDILRGLSVEHDIDLYSVYSEDTDSHSLALLKGHLQDIRLIENEQITNLAASRNDLKKWLKDIGKNKQYYDIIQLEYPHTVYLTNFMKQYGKKVGFTFMECQTKSNIIKIQEMIKNNDLTEMPHFTKGLWEYAVAEKFALQNADFLIAVTPEDADFLQRLYPRKPSIIPTCLSQLELIDKLDTSGTKPEPGRVAFLGYFGHYPNIDGIKWYLSKIHPIIKSQVPDYEFLIIGAGDTRPLQALTAHDESVKFTGRVDNIIPYLQSASVCILPLITGAGIRGKLNQYSIAGRPSVSTTIGNKGLNYEHGRSVMIADKASAFAADVIELLVNQDKNQALAEQARAHAEKHFSWDKHLNSLVDIYRGLLLKD